MNVGRIVGKRRRERSVVRVLHFLFWKNIRLRLILYLYNFLGKKTLFLGRDSRDVRVFEKI